MDETLHEGIQTLWMVVVAVAATLPVLVAFLLWKRQAEFQFQVQSELRKQMQEQIDAQQKTIRFLTGRVDELEQARAREYAETEILRQETENLRQEVGELRSGVASLTRQLEGADMTPAWRPPVKAGQENGPGKDGKQAAVDAPALQQFLAEHFNLEDMADLAMRLEVDIEDVGGETKEAKARSLVSYMKRRKRLVELRDLARQLRPEGRF